MEVIAVSVHPEGLATFRDIATGIEGRFTEKEVARWGVLIDDPSEHAKGGDCPLCREPYSVEVPHRPVAYAEGRYWHQVCYKRVQRRRDVAKREAERMAKMKRASA